MPAPRTKIMHILQSADRARHANATCRNTNAHRSSSQWQSDGPPQAPPRRLARSTPTVRRSAQQVAERLATHCSQIDAKGQKQHMKVQYATSRAHPLPRGA
eukprot:3369753-Alexandrium_andersonii.AAC.1